MATRIYRWKGKKYTDETLHEAPKEFLKLLKERGFEVTDDGATKTAASKADKKDDGK